MSTNSDALRPPEPPGFISWAKNNLFNNWYNGLITILSIATLFWVLKVSINWLSLEADWRPIAQFPLLLMVGQYPREMLWRVGISLATISFLFGVSWGVWGNLIQSFAITLGALLGVIAVIPFKLHNFDIPLRLLFLVNVLLIYIGFILGKKKTNINRYLFAAWMIAAALITLLLLPGINNSSLLPKVSTTQWGGFLVTILLAVGGITLSFPIGVFLALGRRSTLPVVKVFCTLFIELIRGVPLITILFMFSLILQVFLPVGSRFDRLLRALMGITIFSAAYMAENVRGGLQSVPQGQIEAAKAIGMNGFQINLLIVLPQALKAVIPAIVGQFIALFKDTTLVIILGINELLGIGRSVVNTNPEFIQLQLEVYIFIALLFWVFSFALSYSSRRLEAALGVGER